MGIKVNYSKLLRVGANTGMVGGALWLVFSMGSCGVNTVKRWGEESAIQANSQQLLNDFQKARMAKFENSEIEISTANAITLTEGEQRFVYNYQQRTITLTTGSGDSKDAGGAFQFSQMDRKELPEQVRRAGCAISQSLAAKFKGELQFPELDNYDVRQVPEQRAAAQSFAQNYCRS